MVSHCVNGEGMLRQQRGTMVKTFELAKKFQTKKLNTLVDLSHEQIWHDNKIWHDIIGHTNNTNNTN